MAYDRIGTGPWAWLKAVGTQEQPLRPDWRVDDNHLLNYVWFSKHPRSLRGGDLLVYYAARHRVLPALVELVSDEVEPDDDSRFKWKMAVRPIVTVGLRESPPLSATTVDALRVRRQSHILLTPREFSIARGLVLAAANASLAAVIDPAGRDRDA